ncbi:MAG: thiolase family protein [Desulfosporosinus sp.]|nr:thiolase family protein [Desulfosporosinus sp.]
MKEISIVSAVRTPICRKGGEYKDMTAADLAAVPMRESLSRSGIAGDEVDQVIFGCVFQQGENAYLARLAALRAGLSATVPAFTPNSLCSSGLLAVSLATQAIQVEKAEVVVAGGVELVSQVPFLVNRNKGEGEEPTLIDTVDVVLTDPMLKQRVGCTAEYLAETYQISRTEQDAYALTSHRRAVEATKEGYSRLEIIPVPSLHSLKGILENEIPVGRHDTGPRSDLTLVRLARFKPMFQEGGSVTVGNSSLPADGAAGLLLMDGVLAAKKGIRSLVKIRDYATVALEPAKMGLASGKAISEVLATSQLKIQDIDLFEITESFAAQILAVGLELNLDWRKVNVHGGTLAYGHPLGASGAIQLVRLIHALHRYGGRYGIASCCAGGGGGIAILVEVC